MSKLCPDGGTCHHSCGEMCWRVSCCGPLSGVFPEDEWPLEVKAEHTDLVPDADLGEVVGEDITIDSPLADQVAALWRVVNYIESRLVEVERLTEHVWPD